MPFTTAALHLHRGVYMNTPEVYVLLLSCAHTKKPTGALTASETMVTLKYVMAWHGVKSGTSIKVVTAQSIKCICTSRQ